MLKVRRVPKKQLDNPTEIHPTKDGLLRVTPDNATMATVMLLTQIRDALGRMEKKLNG
jgi:hypothetical protein